MAQPIEFCSKTVEHMLVMVERLNEHLCYKGEDLVGSRNDQEESETNNAPLRSLRLDHPPLGSTHLYEGSPFSRLSHHLRLLKIRLIKLQDLHAVVRDELHNNSNVLSLYLMVTKSTEFYTQNSNLIKRDVEGVSRMISDLVGKVPLLPDKPRRNALTFQDIDYNIRDNRMRGCDYFPGIHAIAEDLNKNEAFRQVKQKFQQLKVERKICLLSFGVFPENREVHRTMLMYWWIGEGIIPIKGAEEAVEEVLKEFTDKKLIQPMEERRKVAPSSYKMTPFVHSSVIHLSTEIGLFDIYRRKCKPSTNTSEMGKVCLVEGSSNKAEAIRKKMLPHNIETVFNVSERYPEFTFKWFSSNRKLIKLSKTSFKSLRVLYLGRWERTHKRHIQVRNPELMKYLRVMKNLRVLSFQGMSGISRLKSSVCKLHKLVVLDLRECSDLTKLPEKIDSLRSLVYLDMTGCYMLEWIPMRLDLLKNLEVLKGFVVSDTIYEGVACTLSLLKKLKKLRKLRIEIHRDDLGVNQLMVDLVKLKALTSLKVIWRRDLNIVRAGKREYSTKINTLPDQLRKLDLQRFPDEELPTWLHPQNLLHLKKLHIGGGRLLKGFGDLPKKATQCAVEVLRLTSLPKLRVGWIELKQIYFPNLSFLENYECPRVTLTPCDGNGIWRSDQD